MDLSRTSSKISLRHMNTMGRESFTMIGPSYQDFHSFLEQSPYAQIKSHKNKQQPETQQNKHEKPWDNDLGKYFEYFERKIKEKKNYFFPSELQTESIEASPDLSPIKILDDGLAQQSSVLDQTIKLDRENSHVRSSSKFGFLSPHQDEATSKILDSAQVDKNVKRLLETMQEKIIKLEFENRKLKKENMDLTNQNKKYLNQVGSFIHEQEKYAKVRDTLEKRVKKLEDYLKDNVESNTALQKILGLSEDEYFERVVAKREPSSSSLSPPKRLSTKIYDSDKSIKRQLSRASTIKIPFNNESGNSSILDKSQSNVGSRKNPSLILKKKNTVSFSDYSPIKGGFSPLKGGRAITAKANGRTASFFDFKREVGQT